jgi:hypothetical protein
MGDIPCVGDVPIAEMAGPESVKTPKAPQAVSWVSDLLLYLEHLSSELPAGRADVLPIKGSDCAPGGRSAINWSRWRPSAFAEGAFAVGARP